MTITPRSSVQIMQDAVGALFCSLLLSGALYLATRSVVVPWLVGCSAGLAGFCLGRWRFKSYSPLSIIVDDKALSIIPRRGPEVNLLWSEVRKAAHATGLGGKWTIWLDDRRIVVRDDGITNEDWREFSGFISGRLHSYGVPVVVDLIHAITG